MPAAAAPLRLTTQDTVDLHRRRLIKLDPRLRAVRDAVDQVPLRSRPAGFAGLARIVCGQMVSVASADAIWRRLEALPQATTPDGFLALGEPGLQGVGLSQGKFRALTQLARALARSEEHTSELQSLPPQAANAALTRQIGRAHV